MYHRVMQVSGTRQETGNIDEPHPLITEFQLVTFYCIHLTALAKAKILSGVNIAGFLSKYECRGCHDLQNLCRGQNVLYI